VLINFKQINQRLYILILLLFFTFKGYADTKLDSLLTELRINENEVEKLNILNSLGDYFVDEDIARAELYYQQGLQNSNQLLVQGNGPSNEIKISKSKLLTGLSYVNYLRFNYRSAIIRLEKSISLKSELFGDPFEGKKTILLYLGLCYQKLSDFQTAIDYFMEAESVNETPEDYGFLSKINYGLASSYQKIKFYDKAIVRYKKVIYLSKNGANVLMTIKANNGLAEIYQETNEWNKSKKTLKYSKQRVKNSSDRDAVIFYALYANQFNHQKQYDSARVYFELGVSENENLKVIQSSNYIFYQYSKFELEQGNYEQAKIYSTKLYELGIKLKDLLIQSQALGLNAEIFEKTKKYSEAYLSLKKQKKLLGLLSVEDSKIKLLKQELLLELKQKELKDSLRYQSILQKREAKLKTQSILIDEGQKTKHILFVGLILVIIALILILVGLRRKKKDNKIITAQKEESEFHQDLLSKQNKSLQTKASLYKILNVSSKDLSIKHVLGEVLDHLVDLEIIGTYGKGYVYLNTEGRINGVDIIKGVSLDEVKEYKTIDESECICGEHYSGFEVEFCDNGSVENHYYVPIVNNNETLGVIVLFTKLTKTEMEKSIDFLNVVSKLLGETVSRHNMTDKLRLAHIENTLKKKEVKKVHDRVNQALTKQAAINDLIGAIINNENIGERIFNYVTDIFNNSFIRRLNITLFDFDKSEVSFYFLRENGVDQLENKPFSIDEFSPETLSGLKKNERIIVRSIKNKEDKSPTDLQMIKNNIDSFVSFPLMADKTLLGSLNISFEDELILSDDQEEFLVMLVEGITIAINQNIMFNQIVSSNSELSMLHSELNSSISYAQKIQESMYLRMSYLMKYFLSISIFLNKRIRWEVIFTG